MTIYTGISYVNYLMRYLLSCWCTEVFAGGSKTYVVIFVVWSVYRCLLYDLYATSCIMTVSAQYIDLLPIKLIIDSRQSGKSLPLVLMWQLYKHTCHHFSECMRALLTLWHSVYAIRLGILHQDTMTTLADTYINLIC